jgi:hypothetical protein
MALSEGQQSGRLDAKPLQSEDQTRLPNFWGTPFLS